MAARNAVELDSANTRRCLGSPSRFSEGLGAACRVLLPAVFFGFDPALARRLAFGSALFAARVVPADVDVEVDVDPESFAVRRRGVSVFVDGSDGACSNAARDLAPEALRVAFF
jgi:hypothetical protein